jgi:hypothetical protein
MDRKNRNPEARAGALRAPKNVCVGTLDDPEDRARLRALQAEHIARRFCLTIPTAAVIAELAFGSTERQLA